MCQGRRQHRRRCPPLPLPCRRRVQVPARPRLPTHLLLLGGETCAGILRHNAVDQHRCSLAPPFAWHTAPPVPGPQLASLTPAVLLLVQVRLGDPEQLAKIMDTDPYFVTQVRPQTHSAMSRFHPASTTSTLMPTPLATPWRQSQPIKTDRPHLPHGCPCCWPATHMPACPYRSLSQDNGAGAPIHFATTYKQLDMVGWRVGGAWIGGCWLC